MRVRVCARSRAHTEWLLAVNTSVPLFLLALSLSYVMTTHARARAEWLLALNTSVPLFILALSLGYVMTTLGWDS